MTYQVRRSGILRLGAAFAAAIAVAGSPAFAWFETGHMTVAEIALRHLEPTARTKALRLLRSAPLDERTDEFRTASVWADDHKSKADAHWHYINWFFIGNGQPGRGKPRNENVVWAITKFRKELANDSNSEHARAQALVWLLHFVGDVHQPMHTVARESAAHPEGDRGGNDFAISSPSFITPPVRNLHYLWDSGGGLFPQVVRPLNTEGQRAIARLADRCEAALNWKQAQKMLNLGNPEAWAKESFAIAKSEAYQLAEGTTPSGDYLKTCQSICEKRVALAGYRLAALLNEAL